MKKLTTKDKKYSIQFALKVADDLVCKLAPYCEKIQVVGSIRRERKMVGDVEILCIPNKVYIGNDLFHKKTEPKNMWEFVKIVNSMEKVKGNASTGKYFQRIHESGIKIDIFTALPETWGVQKMIRTGPADFSKQMVTDIKARGYQVADGGHLQKYVKQGKWENVPCYYEKDFFDITGMPNILPVARI